MSVGSTTELFNSEHAEKAFGIFRAVTEHVSKRIAQGLVDLLPDDRIRRRVLEAIKGMAPRADDKWGLSLHDSTDTEFAALTVDTRAFVQETLVPAAQREAEWVVTGELNTIYFAERKLTLIYPPTNKELVCIYDEELEDLLYKRRRDLIQVTGRVVFDEQGSPKQIIDVTDIRDLDLSPLEISTVRHGALSLRLTPTLTLEPALDDSKQLLCVENHELDINVFAPTREALLAELHEHLAMLWQEYAQAPDDALDAPARQLKYALLACMTETTHAA